MNQQAFYKQFGLTLVLGRVRGRGFEQPMPSQDSTSLRSVSRHITKIDYYFSLTY